MKLLTANFSRRTREIIISTLTIIAAAGLLLLGSITVDAADYEYPYVMAVDDTVYVSNGEFILTARDPNMTTSGYGFYGMYSLGDTVLKIVWSPDLNDWTTEEIMLQEAESKNFYRLGTDTRYLSQKYVLVVDSPQQSPVEFWLSKSIITNVSWNDTEISVVGSYSNDLTQLPQGLTENDIKTIINNQINRETLVGALATQIRLDTEDKYNQYTTGDITHTQMQQVLTDNAQSLSQMIPETLLDAIEINNALTYNQTIQDIVLLSSSSEIKEVIGIHLQNAVMAYFDWQSGIITLPDATNQVENSISQLVSTLIDGRATTNADINALNTAITFGQTLLDAMSGSQDLDESVSDEMQSSDDEELTYLDEMLVNSGHQTVTDISPIENFSQSQKNETQKLMDIIWENEFIKRLIPLCAGFMVVCVALGVKYKV